MAVEFSIIMIRLKFRYLAAPQATVHAVVPTKSDNDVILCLELRSKTLTCTLHLSICESIDRLCINPILWIGLIHKIYIDSKSPITL